MRSASIKFIVSVFVLTALYAGLEFVLNSKIPPQMQMHSWLPLLLLFATSVIVVHSFLLKAAQGPGKDFARAFILSTTLKFFLYLLILIVFLLFAAENVKALALHFLFYYASFTILEVSMLQSALKSSKAK
jgi:hypothetical protein